MESSVTPENGNSHLKHCGNFNLKTFCGIFRIMLCNESHTQKVCVLQKQVKKVSDAGSTNTGNAPVGNNSQLVCAQPCVKFQSQVKLCRERQKWHDDYRLKLISDGCNKMMLRPQWLSLMSLI